MERILAIVAIVMVVILFLSTTRRTFVAADMSLATSTETAAVIGALGTSESLFYQEGTLVFYPNNVGPVPYLFYQDARGTTVAKALVFGALPLTDFSSWTGARVAVSGELEREHVLVREITYLDPP